MRAPQLPRFPLQLRDPLLIIRCGTWPRFRVNFRLPNPGPQRFQVDTQAPGGASDLPVPLPSRSRTSNIIFTARSHSSSGYLRCAAAMTPHPKDRSLEDSLGRSNVTVRTNCAGRS
jgi:hypothetical protein